MTTPTYKKIADLSSVSSVGSSDVFPFQPLGATQAYKATLAQIIAGALVNPSLTGTATAPTPTTGDNSTNIANTAYVQNALALLAATGISFTPTGSITATSVQTAIAQLDSLKAPITSPAFTGSPTVPTPTASDNSTKIPSTAWVNGFTYSQAQITSLLAAKAPLVSPTFTGTPNAPTQSTSDNSAAIATTAYVNNKVNSLGLSTATNSAYGTVKTNSLSATPIVYLKSEVDAFFPVSVLNGGTGATDTATARANLSAAKSGSNTDITSLSNLSSLSLTGSSTFPTATATDSSQTVATTAFVHNAISNDFPAQFTTQFASAKQMKQIQTNTLTTTTTISTTVQTATGLSLAFTPISASSQLLIEVNLTGCAISGVSGNGGRIYLGWGGSPQILLTDNVAYTASGINSASAGTVAPVLLLASNHNSLSGSRTYQIFAALVNAGGSFIINNGTSGYSSITITEILV